MLCTQEDTLLLWQLFPDRNILIGTGKLKVKLGKIQSSKSAMDWDPGVANTLGHFMLLGHLKRILVKLFIL